MTDTEIQLLKTRIKSGGVLWKNIDGICVPVVGMKLDWIEFADTPELKEPAAFLLGGGAVALYNVELDSFVTIQPCVATVTG